MIGAKPFNNGYMSRGGSRKLNKIISNENNKLKFILFPATNFALGSYNPKDIPILQQLIYDYKKISPTLTFSKQKAPQVCQLIQKYNSQLSSEFWRNFIPMNHRQLPKTSSPTFNHPSNLLNLTFAEANYLVGHFRLFTNTTKSL